MVRIAIVNSDRCKPKNCGQPCKKYCPINRQGKQCIVVEPTSKVAEISETLCIGEGICVQKCPYNAIKIINLPENLTKETTHRYGMNSFKLHRLPTPRSGRVLGLVGSNGTGKSTAIKILSGGIKPNLGNYQNPPSWEDIILEFRGSALQNYFKKFLENNLKAVLKPQHVDQIPKAATGTVADWLAKKDEKDCRREICEQLELNGIMDRQINQLSGGELQRFTIALVCVQAADIYIFDEPSSYLDIKQRLNVARAIRLLLKDDNYVIVVEHDLAVLDFMSDYISCLYGEPGAFGVVTSVSGVREGINQFLDGYIPSANLRFRPEPLNFSLGSENLAKTTGETRCKYPEMRKTLGEFELTVNPGGFCSSEIIVMLGENGTGKTTMIKLLAGKLSADNHVSVPEILVSYKPQTISPKSECTVRQLLHNKIRDAYLLPTFMSEVIKPLQVHQLMDQKVSLLSGGELQRVALTICLGKPADVYLIDEPSAYLDSEQRLAAAKVIKRHVINAKKTAFVVEHDFFMGHYMADRVIVFEGKPGKATQANSPECVEEGFNRFLKMLDVTVRQDTRTGRLRINKPHSAKMSSATCRQCLQDNEQKKSGMYFLLDREL